jgi:secreted Zn-dependent insulinase-like peptidase
MEELYPADVADLCCPILLGDKGIVLKVSGFNEKLPVSLTKCEQTFHFTTCEMFFNMHNILIYNKLIV